MSSRLVIVGLVAGIVAVSAWWWGTGGASRRAPPDVELARRVERLHPEPAVRERAHARASDDGAVRPLGAPDPASESSEPLPPVSERLRAPLPPLRYDGHLLSRVLGDISARSDVPVHVHADLRERIESEDMVVELKLDSSETSERVLEILAATFPLRVDVEPTRVVIRAFDAEPTTESTSTYVVPPEELDPRALAALTIELRVLLPDGRPASGALVLPEEGSEHTADADGRVTLYMESRNPALRAMLPFNEPSPRWAGAGRYGDVLEADVVLGPPAGVVDAVVVCDGAPVGGAYVYVRTSSGEPTWSDRLPLPRTESDGAVSCGSVPAGVALVTVVCRGFATTERRVPVVAGVRQRVSIDLTRQTLAERLREQRVSLSITNATPAWIVWHLLTEHDVEVFLDDSLARELGDRRVSLHVADASAERALEDLCAAIGHCRLRYDDETWSVYVERATD